jgi:hypothetical protein
VLVAIAAAVLMRSPGTGPADASVAAAPAAATAVASTPAASAIAATPAAGGGSTAASGATPAASRAAPARAAAAPPAKKATAAPAVAAAPTATPAPPPAVSLATQRERDDAATAQVAATRNPRLVPPAETCKDKFFLAKEFCLQAECAKPGYQNFPACIKLKEEARLRDESRVRN